MFVAMNRFQVKPGHGGDFEQTWRERESYLDDVPGFVAFHLLRGDEEVYLSHSTWESRADFEAWTQSEAFAKAHAQARSGPSVLMGPPQVSLYEAVDLKSPTS